jgi:hypothetical protein
MVNHDSVPFFGGQPYFLHRPPAPGNVLFRGADIPHFGVDMEADPIPRQGFDTRHNIPCLLAAAMIAAFVVCGIRGREAAYSRATAGAGAFNSTDRFLLQALHVGRGAEQITNAISNLPPLQPLAIVLPVDNVYGSILLPTIGSITWPHPIYLVQVDNGNAAKTPYVLRAHHFAAALYYDIAPPVPNSNDRRVGLMTIVPIQR